MTLLLALLSGCIVADEEVGEAAPDDHPDVVLITLDTTRADRIGAYGYDGAATEHLDGLAARGTRFDAAFTVVPLTIPAHGSIFTGRYPAELGVRANGDGWIDGSERMLAEAFRDGGYATVGSVGAFVTTEEWGFAQGFEAFFDDLPRGGDFWHAERPADAVVGDVLGWLKARPADDGRPVFAWVHLYDAHFPFETGEPWLSEVGGRPYDAELARVDDQVGRLLEAFDPEQTLVVVVGDHGEGLGEHGELAHGLFVYDPVARVPWMMAGPGIPVAVEDQPVSLVDVAPTVLAAAGLPALEAVSGRVVPSGEPAPLAIESWQLAQRFGLAPHLAVVAEGHKLIDLPEPELYALDDREEATNLAESDPERVARLKALRQGFGHGAPSADPAHPSSPARIRQLEALGYVEGGFLGEGDRPDPKQARELIRDVQLIELRTLEGDQAAVTELVRGLAEAHPDVVEIQMKHARILAREGKAEAATEAVRRLVERDPDNALAIHLLGTLLAGQGQFEEAARHFHDAAERMPWAGRLRVMAVAALFEVEGGADSAFALGRQALQRDPEDHAMAGILGVELVRRGNLGDGLGLLEHGLKADPPERDVAYLLAAAATGKGSLDRALDLLGTEVRHYPTNHRAWMARLRLLGRKGAWEDQLAAVQAYLRGPGRVAFARLHQPSLAGVDPAVVPAAAKTPAPFADFRQIEAQALFNLRRYPEARQALDVGLAIDPDRPGLLLLDANLLKAEGHDQAALARFGEAKAAKARSDAASEGDPWAGLEAPPGGD